MRLILALAAAPLLGAAPVAVVQPAASMPVANPYQAEPDDCPETPMSLARKQTERPQLRRLDQLPDAQAFAAVDRRVDRCPAPMLLSEARAR